MIYKPCSVYYALDVDQPIYKLEYRYWSEDELVVDCYGIRSIVCTLPLDLFIHKEIEKEMKSW